METNDFKDPFTVIPRKSILYPRNESFTEIIYKNELDATFREIHSNVHALITKDKNAVEYLGSMQYSGEQFVHHVKFPFYFKRKDGEAIAAILEEIGCNITSIEKSFFSKKNICMNLPKKWKAVKYDGAYEKMSLLLDDKDNVRVITMPKNKFSIIARALSLEAFISECKDNECPGWCKFNIYIGAELRETYALRIPPEVKALYRNDKKEFRETLMEIIIEFINMQYPKNSSFTAYW